MTVEKRVWETFWDSENPDFIETRDQDLTVYPRLAELAGVAGPSVLDVGCASCLLYLPCEHRGIRYVGVDFTEKFLVRARELYPGIEVHYGSVFDLPFPDRSFHTVLAKALLEHLQPDEWAAAIGEMLRVASRRLLLSFFKPPSRGRTRVKDYRTYVSVRRNVAEFRAMLDVDRVRRYERLPHVGGQEIYVVDLV